MCNTTDAQPDPAAIDRGRAFVLTNLSATGSDDPTDRQRVAASLRGILEDRVRRCESLAAANPWAAPDLATIRAEAAAGLELLDTLEAS